MKNDIIIIFSLKYLSNKKMHFSLTNIIFLPYFIEKFFFFTIFYINIYLKIDKKYFFQYNKIFSKNCKKIFKNYNQKTF
ncbi:hypothetical protein BKN14_05515 [Candidatus Gracilibacteria bacterium HOT-871]|nr:hypothetical protein BKN14_05515 [Candidatus Gracilibacteria bacterium HOT-871]